MKTVIKVFAIVMVLGLVFGFMPAREASATTLCVNTGGTSGCHPTLQAAIAAAAAGDTITVATGTYVETGQIVINKNLTIIGAGKTTTLIKPAQDTGSSGDARGWFLVQSGITFNLSNLTLDGTGYKIYQGIRNLGSGTINNVGFTHMIYPTYYGVAVAAMGGNVDISNSTFDNIGRIGVIYFGAGTTGTYDNNVYTGKGAGDWLDYAVEVGGGAVATITNNVITDCLGVATSDGSTSAGVLVTTYFGAGSAAVIYDNTFTNNSTGIAVGYNASDTSTVSAYDNNFANNDFGISSTAPAVDADSNYWGTAISSEIEDLVDTQVTFEPYWVDAAMTILSDAVPTTVYVDDSYVFPDCGTHICGYDAFTKVEEGVAAVAAGGTVNVADGTYNPPAKMTLSKAITISGPTTGEAKVIGVGGLGLTIFEITTSNVTIQNLTLTLANSPLAHIGIIHAPDGAKTNINITGNTIYVDPQAGAMSTWWGQAVYLGRLTTASNVSDNLIYNMRGGIVVAYSSALTISDNVIYNTKGGIMNYTGTVADADARVITGNSWNDIHNEWDIVWNSGGGPYVMDMDKYVLQLSKANTDAHVLSQMTTGVLAELTGNRSHVYVDDTGTLTLKADNGNVNVPYAKIQDGINAVVPGGTVYIAAGTYTENVLVNKYAKIFGAGSGTDGSVITSPATVDYKVGVLQITASGPSIAEPILLQDLRIQPIGQAGISIGRFTEATGLFVSNLKLDNVFVIGTNNNAQTEQERGLYVDLTSALDHLTVFDSAFNNLAYGWYIQKQVSADTSTVSNVTITRTTFNHNNLKGLYAEKLTDTTFTDCTWDENGFDATGLPSYFIPWMAGIDINLKAGTYQNISFINPTITDNALGGAQHGVGITIKARDDGTTYGPFPATLTNVLIQGGLITGNERGIRIGEPLKNNSGPTNVVITGSSLYGNVKTYAGTDGSAYGDVVNYSLAPVNATGNWWGSAAGPAAGQTYGDVASCGWLDAAPPDGEPVAKPVVNTTRDTSFCSIQAAIDDAATVNGDVITVAAGTYTGPILVNKSVTLLGPNALINPNTGTRVPEAVLQGTTLSGLSQFVNIDAENVVIKGFTFDNLRIDNYNSSTREPITGDVVENNTFTNVAGTAIYLRDGRDAPGVYSTGVNVSNNKIDPTTSAGSVDYNAGTGIIIFGAEASTISNNVILSAAYNGIQLARCNEMTISGNIATGAAQPALQIAQWNDGTFTISGNTFSTTSTTKAAVRLYGFTNSYYPLFNFTGNTIQDSKYAFQIGHGDPGKGLNDIRDADYSFSGNTFTNVSSHRLIIYLAAEATVDEKAEMDALFAQLFGAGNTAALITSADPYTYVVAVCTTNCYVATTGDDMNPGTESAPFLTIQKGINAVTAGGTVHVAAGTYVENVVVNKSVELAGAGAGSTIVVPAISNPNPCTGSSMCGGLASNVILVEANNVKIHDLTVDGDNPALTSGIVRGGADLDARNGIIKNTNGTYNNLEVYNATVQNIYLRGMYSTGGSFNFHDNVVTNVQGDAYSIAMFAWYGPGIYENNLVSYANDGISANHSNGIQWINNTITMSGSGIHTDNSGDGGGVTDIIRGNTVDCTGISGGYGIWTFVNYLPVTVENNTVVGCDVAYSAWGGAFNTTPKLVTFSGNTATAPAPNTNSVGFYLTTDTIGYGYTDVAVNFINNTLTGFDYGLQIEAGPASWNPEPYMAKTISGTIEHNNITGSTSMAVYEGDQGTYTVTLEENWWGSVLGPQAPITEGLDVMQWCGTANPVCLDLMPQSGTTLTLTGSEVLGDAKIFVPGLTVVLADGANIANAGGPCFSVNADHTTIMAATKLGAACTPAAGFNGIDVAGGLTDINIANLEFTGAGTDGIHFAGVVDYLAIFDNWFHGLAGDAIDFGAHKPTGDVFIQGNLFEENTGLGIRATVAIPAEFNSWGHIDGAALGDGASSSVDWTPWTHVDLYLGSTTAPVVGQPITFTVYGNLKNTMGAAFTLKFPADKLTYLGATNLSGFIAAGPSLFTTAAGEVRFNGIAPTSTPISGVNAPIFSVTFLVVGDPALLDLDETTDLFAMVPTLAGPSTNIYALKLVDAVVTTTTYKVRGTFYMQGHSGDFKSGIPGTLTGMTNGIYQTTSISTVPNNMVFNFVPAQSYIFITLQPRYLNITPDLAKEVTVTNADVTFASSLVLLGGNAIWTDNIIDVNDASAVGSLYGIGTIADNADVTFDGLVNILDLSLVGGNMDKTSSSAYASWDPQP